MIIIINMVFWSSWGSPLSHPSITMFFPVVVFQGWKPPPQWGSQNRAPPFCFLALWFSDSCQFNHNYNKYGIWEFLRKPIKPSVYYYVFPSGRFPGLGRLDMAWGNVRGVVCCCSTSRRQIDCLWGYPWRMKACKRWHQQTTFQCS